MPAESSHGPQATRHAELEAIDQLLAASGNNVDWSSGGLLAAEAIKLLRQFYASGNPNAPIPHRPVVEK
ncbi:TPA: hypothetical protein ACH3X3_005188 [Trebouxia sp. C0006]